MQTSVDISTKSDIVNFLIFKRRLRQQLKKILAVFCFVVVIALLILCIKNKNFFVKYYITTTNIISKVSNKIFSVDVKKVRVHLDKYSLIDDNEINDIITQLSGTTIDKKRMKQLIDNIIEQNKLIENVYIRKTLANGELSVFLKEKKIVGVYYSDECLHDDVSCVKNIISIDNQIIPYHKIKNNDNILKIYGKIGTADVADIYKNLTKYNLLEKMANIKFYTSGRFDIILKNNLLLKFPRNNWKKAIKQFNKLDAEYLLSTDIQSIKYIDLRIDDKLTIG